MHLWFCFNVKDFNEILFIVLNRKIMVDTIINARTTGSSMTDRPLDSHSMTAKTPDSNSMTAKTPDSNSMTVKIPANNITAKTAVVATSSSSHMITMISKEEIILGKITAGIIRELSFKSSFTFIIKRICMF